jgi:transcriptional antiterminator RfaH
MAWYVFYTRIRAEERAGEAVAELGFSVFVPFERRFQRLPSGKTRRIKAALFPRYGFVAFDLYQNWPAILAADGIMDLLRNQGDPIAVPTRAVDSLKLADRCGLLDRTKPPRIGIDVEVVSGPFAGFIGRVLRCRTGDRIDVLLKFLYGQVSASVPLMALKEV